MAFWAREELSRARARWNGYRVGTRVTTNVSNSGPVFGAGDDRNPTGAGGATPCIGIESDVPVIVPLATGAAKRSWTFRTSYRSPAASTPLRSTLTLGCLAQLYTMMCARPASYGLGRTTTFVARGGASSTLSRQTCPGAPGSRRTMSGPGAHAISVSFETRAACQ